MTVNTGNEYRRGGGCGTYHEPARSTTRGQSPPRPLADYNRVRHTVWRLPLERSPTQSTSPTELARTTKNTPVRLFRRVPGRSAPQLTEKRLMQDDAALRCESELAFDWNRPLRRKSRKPRKLQRFAFVSESGVFMKMS